MNYFRKLQSNFPKSFRFQEIRQNAKCRVRVKAAIKFCRKLVHIQIAREERRLKVSKLYFAAK